MMLLLTTGIVGVLCSPAMGVQEAAPAGSQAWEWGNYIAGAAVLVVGAIIWCRAKEARAVDEHPFWVYLACAGLTWFAHQLAMTMVAQLLGTGTTAQALREQAIVHTIGAIVGLVAGLALVRLVSLSAPGAGLAVTARGVLAGLVLTVAAWPIAQSAAMVASRIQRAMTGAQPEAIGHPTLRALVDDPANPWALLLAGAAVVGVPVIEEIIFRGFLQTALVRLTKRAWLGILVTALLFGAMHAGQDMQWHALASVTALGGCLGFALERTRSLGVCIGMHMGFNGANVALALWLMA